jgi:aspartyl-tRNA(Asn)/glutamyl-tRNA(Gln) amidotransferase subunit C
MATTEEVQKLAPTPNELVWGLAALARIRVEDAELEKFTREFDAILAYVGQLEKVDLPSAGEEKPALRNVMRADGEPHTPSAYTEKLAEQFSAREGNALSVKQILSHTD